MFKSKLQWRRKKHFNWILVCCVGGVKLGHAMQRSCLCCVHTPSHTTLFYGAVFMSSSSSLSGKNLIQEMQFFH